MHKNTFENAVLKDMSRYSVRQRVLAQFPKENGLSAFTLPGTSFAFEGDLFDDYREDLDLTGVEECDETYDAARKKLLSLGIPMEFLKQNDLSFWQKPAEKTLDFVWLDYCAQWNHAQREAILAMVSNGHLSFDKGNPIVALTVQNSRESRVYGDELLKAAGITYLKDPTITKARVVGIPKLINKALECWGHTFIPQFVMYYKDSVRDMRAQPMLLFVFEVVNQLVDYDAKRIPFISSNAGPTSKVKLH